MKGKTDMKQLDLFDQSTLALTEVGTKEWKKSKYNELIKLPFQELNQYDQKLYDQWEKIGKITEEDYWTLSVITDIFHSHYYSQFMEEYPKCYASKREINYL